MGAGRTRAWRGAQPARRTVNTTVSATAVRDFSEREGIGAGQGVPLGYTQKLHKSLQHRCRFDRSVAVFWDVSVAPRGITGVRLKQRDRPYESEVALASKGSEPSPGALRTPSNGVRVDQGVSSEGSVRNRSRSPWASRGSPLG